MPKKISKKAEKKWHLNIDKQMFGCYNDCAKRDRVSRLEKERHMRTKSDERMQDIKKFIESFYEGNDRSPSVREISDALGMSKSNVQRYLSEMSDNGMLEKTNVGYGTGLTALMGGGAINVPRVGYVPCGPLTEEVECIDEYIKLPLSFVGGAEKVFLLTASGNSMIGAGIDDGDLVLVKQQETANNGDTSHLRKRKAEQSSG